MHLLIRFRYDKNVKCFLKLLFVFSLYFLLFVFLPFKNIVFAEVKVTIEKMDGTAIQDNKIVKSSGDFKIVFEAINGSSFQVTNRQGVDPRRDYQFDVYKKSIPFKQNTCNDSEFENGATNPLHSQSFDTQNSKFIEVFIQNSAGNIPELGDYNFNLYRNGRDCGDTTSVANGSFSIVQGEDPSLVASDTVQKGSHTPVWVANPKDGAVYTIWWDGDAGSSFSGPLTTPNEDYTDTKNGRKTFKRKVIFPDQPDSTDLHIPTTSEVRPGFPYRLCLAEGDTILHSVLGKTCVPAWAFQFSAVDGPLAVTPTPKQNNATGPDGPVAGGATLTPTPKAGEVFPPCKEYWIYNNYDPKNVNNPNEKLSSKELNDKIVSDKDHRNFKGIYGSEAAAICHQYDTAIGSFATDPGGFVTTLFGFLLSISGGIAVLMIIISGYNFMLSQGNPEAIKEARERFTSAIVGLLFIIFSLIILELIGVRILHIPGLFA